MTYLTLFIGIVIGLVLNKLLPSYFSKKGENLATKEDIGKITKVIEEVKNIYKEKYDLSNIEREFYNDMIKELQKFLSVIKRYELKAGTGENSLTHEVAMKDTELAKQTLDFKDAASEILARAFVFLNEENYKLLQGAFKPKNNFAEIRHNLLDAMRQSIHRDTKLKADEDSLDIKY